MPSAALYLFRDIFYVQPMRRTVAGFWVGGTEVLVAHDTHAALAALNTAREASHGVIAPLPDAGTNFLQPVLTAAKVSHRVFMAHARLVDIDWEEGMCLLTPTKNEGVRDGFAPLPACQIKVDHLSADALQCAIEQVQ